MELFFFENKWKRNFIADQTLDLTAIPGRWLVFWVRSYWSFLTFVTSMSMQVFFLQAWKRVVRSFYSCKIIVIRFTCKNRLLELFEHFHEDNFSMNHGSLHWSHRALPYQQGLWFTWTRLNICAWTLVGLATALEILMSQEDKRY